MSFDIVILAAGKGTRLADCSDNRPKSLVEIEPGQSYLGLQLQSFSKTPYQELIVVSGFGQGVLTSYIKSQAPRDCKTVFNSDFERGNILSLAAARDHLSRDFILFNADHYYSDVTYNTLTQKRDGISVFCDHDRDLQSDDMKVLSVDGRVRQISKQLTDFDCGYVGVTYVSKPCSEAYWTAFDQVVKETDGNGSVEQVVQVLADGGDLDVSIQDISGSWWTEIDTPEDLQRAKKTIMESKVHNRAS